MNCHSFQKRLYEYLDGTLSLWSRTAARRHLSRCAECRGRLARENEQAESLSEQFDKLVAPLVLDHQTRARWEGMLAEHPHPHARRNGFHLLRWSRGVVGVLVVAVLTGILLFTKPFDRPQPPAPQMARASGNDSQTVAINLAVVTPTYVFRREGNYVVDALYFGTNVLTGSYLVDNAKKVNQQRTPL
jgi:anti-sigma factor RsiW